MVVQFGLFDSPLALILVYPTFLVPVCTWRLIGYFNRFPMSSRNARWSTAPPGCRSCAGSRCHWRCPADSAGIFSFTLSWNEFMYALAFIQGSANKTAWSRS